jgi:hypothetical protein
MAAQPNNGGGKIWTDAAGLSHSCPPAWYRLPTLAGTYPAVSSCRAFLTNERSIAAHDTPTGSGRARLSAMIPWTPPLRHGKDNTGCFRRTGKLVSRPIRGDDGGRAGLVFATFTQTLRLSIVQLYMADSAATASALAARTRLDVPATGRAGTQAAPSGLRPWRTRRPRWRAPVRLSCLPPTVGQAEPQYPADEFSVVQADAQLADRCCRIAPPVHARLQFGAWHSQAHLTDGSRKTGTRRARSA